MAFGPIEKVEFINEFIEAVHEVSSDFNGMSRDTIPLPFQVSGEGVLSHKMEEVGLINVQVKQIVHKYSFYSGQEMWNWVLSSNPIVTSMISGLNAEQRNQVIQSLEKSIKARASEQEPAIFDVAVNIGLGEKIK